MLVLHIIGCFALAVLTTLAFLFVFLHLYAKFLDWLDRHYGRTIRQSSLGRLLSKPFQKDGNGSYYGRPHAEYEVYSHYITKYASIVLKWVGQTLHVKIRHPSDSSNDERYETSSKGFVQTRHSPIHIRTIVNWLRRRVNHSGKEPLCAEDYHQNL